VPVQPKVTPVEPPVHHGTPYEMAPPYEPAPYYDEDYSIQEGFVMEWTPLLRIARASIFMLIAALTLGVPLMVLPVDQPSEALPQVGAVGMAFFLGGMVFMISALDTFHRRRWSGLAILGFVVYSLPLAPVIGNMMMFLMPWPFGMYPSFLTGALMEVGLFLVPGALVDTLFMHWRGLEKNKILLIVSCVAP